MELFTLLAKLTLDSKEFDKGIDEAEKKGNFEIEEAKLGLDKSDFDSGITEAENAHVDDIDVDMELDTTDFNTNIEEAKTKSQEYTDTIGGMFENIKKIMVGAGIVGLLKKINDFFWDAINMTAEHADVVQKGARAMGVSNEAYQKWDYVLDQNRGSVNDLKRATILFHKVLGDSEWLAKAKKNTDEWGDEFQEELEGGISLSQDQIDAFTDLGMYQDILNGKYKTTEELMDATFDALTAFADNPTKQTSLVESIFGKGADGIKSMVSEGKEAMDELMQYPSKNGLIMSDEEIKNGVEFGDAMSDLNKQIQAVKEGFVKDILPVLKDAIVFLTGIFAFFNGRIDKNSLTNLLEGVDKDFAKNIANIDTMEGEAYSLVDQLRDMGDYTKLSAQEQDKWNQMAARAIELYPELTGYIDQDKHSISQNTEEIKENIRQWSNMMRRRALDQAVQQKEEIFAEKAAEAADKQVKADMKRREAEGKRFAAIKEGNRLLAENEALQAKFYKATGMKELGSDASWDTLNQLTQFLGEVGTVKQWESEYYGLVDDFRILNDEAATLESESKTANEEIEKERENLELYKQVAAEHMGILLDDTDAFSTKADTAAEKVRSLAAELNNVPKRVIVDFAFTGDTGIPYGNGNGVKMYTQAIGDPYVPYDNYPSLLHRGEMVLPATEARKYREGGGDASNLEDRIIEAIQKGMSNAQVDAYIDGEKVTRTVSNRLARENGARRYNP